MATISPILSITSSTNNGDIGGDGGRCPGRTHPPSAGAPPLGIARTIAVFFFLSFRTGLMIVSPFVILLVACYITYRLLSYLPPIILPSVCYLTYYLLSYLLHVILLSACYLTACFLPYRLLSYRLFSYIVCYRT